jgi:hypothetical protein
MKIPQADEWATMMAFVGLLDATLLGILLFLAIGYLARRM